MSIDEQGIRHVLSRDLSAGTEEFRDALLARCLAALDSDDLPSDLDDGEIELLAAAGSLSWQSGKVRGEDAPL